MVQCPLVIAPYKAERDEGLVTHTHSNSVLSSGKTKADGVIAIRRIVVVAVSGTAVPAVVDPRAATQHAVVFTSTFTRHYSTQPVRDDAANSFCTSPHYRCLALLHVPQHTRFVAVPM